MIPVIPQQPMYPNLSTTTPPMSTLAPTSTPTSTPVSTSTTTASSSSSSSSAEATNSPPHAPAVLGTNLPRAAHPHQGQPFSPQAWQYPSPKVASNPSMKAPRQPLYDMGVFGHLHSSGNSVGMGTDLGHHSGFNNDASFVHGSTSQVFTHPSGTPTNRFSFHQPNATQFLPGRGYPGGSFSPNIHSHGVVNTLGRPYPNQNHSASHDNYSVATNYSNFPSIPFHLDQQPQQETISVHRNGPWDQQPTTAVPQGDGAKPASTPPKPLPNTNSSIISDEMIASNFAYCLERGSNQVTRLIPLDKVFQLASTSTALAEALSSLRPTEPMANGMIALPILQGQISGRAQDKPITSPNIEKSPALPSVPDVSSASVTTNSQTVETTTTATTKSRRCAEAGAASSKPPKKYTKTHCDKWIHDGVCAFTQQGCKFKHEMPLDRETQLKLGLFQGLPIWYRKRQAELERKARSHGGGTTTDGTAGAAATTCMTGDPRMHRKDVFLEGNEDDRVIYEGRPRSRYKRSMFRQGVSGGNDDYCLPATAAIPVESFRSNTWRYPRSRPRMYHRVNNSSHEGGAGYVGRLQDSMHAPLANSSDDRVQSTTTSQIHDHHLLFHHERPRSISTSQNDLAQNGSSYTVRDTINSVQGMMDGDVPDGTSTQDATQPRHEPESLHQQKQRHRYYHSLSFPPSLPYTPNSPPQSSGSLQTSPPQFFLSSSPTSASTIDDAASMMDSDSLVSFLDQDSDSHATPTGSTATVTTAATNITSSSDPTPAVASSAAGTYTVYRGSTQLCRDSVSSNSPWGPISPPKARGGLHGNSIAVSQSGDKGSGSPEYLWMRSPVNESQAGGEPKNTEQSQGKPDNTDEVTCLMDSWKLE